MLRLLLVALICSTSYADDGINAFNEARAKIVADRTYDEIKYVIVQQDLAKMISENSLEMSLDDAPSPSSNSSLAPIASPPKKKGVKGAKVSKEVLSALGGKEACKKGDGDDCVITLKSKNGVKGSITLDLGAPDASPMASPSGSKKGKKSGKNESSSSTTVGPSSSPPVGLLNDLLANADKASTTDPSPNSSPAASPDSWAPVTMAPVTLAPVTSSSVTLAPVTLAPVTLAPVNFTPVTLAPVTLAPLVSTTTSAPLVSTTTSAPVVTTGAPVINNAASGDRLTVNTIPLTLKMSGDFDIAVDDDPIFEAIGQQLHQYLTQTVPYLLKFDLDVTFEPTTATDQGGDPNTLTEGADTSSVATALVEVTMHLASDKDGELQDFTDIVATDILVKFFQESTLQVLLSDIVDRGVDMSFLEILGDAATDLTVEHDVAMLSEIPEPQSSVKEDVESNTGYISAIVGSSCVLALGVAAFMKVGRKANDVDNSHHENHHDYQTEEMAAFDNGKNDSRPTFPDLIPINFRSYVDRRRHGSDDDESIDISLMDGPDLIASNLSPTTEKSALSDAIRMNLKQMSSAGEGFECSVSGDMMFAVDLL